MPLNLRDFVQKHLNYSYKRSVEYRGDEIVELIDMAKPIICRDREGSALVDVPIPVNVVGDIHGQFGDLLRIFSALGLPGKHRYLFLGDYVDRGENSVECICLLLAMRLLAPDRVYLLRGNHECELVNRTYGFWEELQRRFSIGLAMKLHKEFNVVFSHLPLAACIRKRILCMHGGISPKLNSLDDIRKIRLPFMDPVPDTLEQDLLWADPSSSINGFEFNRLRDVSVCFGADMVKKVCKKLDLDLIIRAHQMMPNGYGFFANRKMVTVFSASNYVPEVVSVLLKFCNGNSQSNKAGILQINSKMMVSFALLNPAGPVAGLEGFKKSFSMESSIGNSTRTL